MNGSNVLFILCNLNIPFALKIAVCPTPKENYIWGLGKTEIVHLPITFMKFFLNV